jgi:hypothetical protein
MRTVALGEGHPWMWATASRGDTGTPVRACGPSRPGTPPPPPLAVVTGASSAKAEMHRKMAEPGSAPKN